MTDENSQLSGEETVEVHQTDISRITPEEQPASPLIIDTQETADDKTISAQSQETTGDEATIMKPAEIPAQASAASLAIADEQTLFLPAQAAEMDRPADERTLLMPVDIAGCVAVPPTQAINPPVYASPDTIPAELAGDNPPPAYYAQPGEYQSPGMLIGEAPVPPEKRRTVLWVVLILVAIFLVGGGTALALVASQRITNTPTQALQQFCDGYTTLNAQETYDILSQSSQAQTSVSQIQASFNELKKLESFAKFSGCTASNVKQNGSTATGTMTLTVSVSFGTISSTSSVSLPVPLVLENNTWKVDMSKMASNFNSMQGIPTLPPTFLTPTVSGSTNQ